MVAAALSALPQSTVGFAIAPAYLFLVRHWAVARLGLMRDGLLRRTSATSGRPDKLVEASTYCSWPVELSRRFSFEDPASSPALRCRSGSPSDMRRRFRLVAGGAAQRW
jgi:hypothetical protein